MVYKFTYLNIVDNSGASSAVCICVLHKYKLQAFVGDELIVSIRSIIATKHVICGNVKLALLIRQKKSINRSNGMRISFKRNAIVLLQSKSKNLIGSRIKGPVTHELRKKKYLRVVCLAASII